MADDIEHDAPSPADSGRGRRAPPTIDLDATEVTTAKPQTSEAPAPEEDPQARPASEQSSADHSARPARPVSPWVIAPFSGAVAAALVIAIARMLGWPQVASPADAPRPSAFVVDDLSARVAGLEARLNKPAADPAMQARAEQTEKSIASLRGELASLHAQSDKLAAALQEMKSAPRESAGSVDLSAINERIAELERVSRAQGTEIAQEGEKITASKTADDLPLRRVLAASLLDVAVRHGDAYETVLTAAKSLAPVADALKPLDGFAATGVPPPFALTRELLTLVPKLSPTPPENTATSTGLLGRLQAGASKLVRIERTDANGNDRGAIVARVTAAALRNDVAEARRELNTLSPADRAPAQAWLDKVDARDAALAASRQFADAAMAALARPGQ